MWYRAISIRQPWAALIAAGIKQEEYRSWSTPHRGPLLIVAGKRADSEIALWRHVPGVELRGGAVALVDLVAVEFRAEDDIYAWQLGAPRRVVYVPVTGKLGLFRVPEANITLQPEEDHHGIGLRSVEPDR